MDSITHIVVGATVGYLIAGKQYGKKSMIWGAIGGSLPDIDVVSGLWLDPVSSLLAHRGITHSLLFLASISPFLAWLTMKFYEKGLQKKKGMRFFVSSFLFLVSGLTGILLNGLLYSFDWLWLIVSLPLSIWGGYQLINIFKKYLYHQDDTSFMPEFKTLWLVFGLTMVSHLFLDTCTTYGTGLFEPFSKMRIALNNISVADIFFTFPACVLLLFTAVHRRTFLFARLNLIWMTAYFVFTFANYHHMQGVFEKSFQGQNIPVKKMMISPSILNNFLWYSVAESDSTFVSGQYSLFDRSNTVVNFNPMLKSYNLLPKDASSRDLKILHSFSQGFYNLCYDKEGDIQWNDLRFGVMGEAAKDAGDYVFKFKLKNEMGQYRAYQSQEMNQTIPEIWGSYWKRVFGI